MDEQLAVTTSPFEITSFEALEKVATFMADAGVYGLKKKSQVMSAMFIANETKEPLSKLMEKKHFFEDGKIADKARYVQAIFERTGMIIWHARSDDMCGASFFRDRAKVDDKAKQRALARFKTKWRLAFAKEPKEIGKLIEDIAELSEDGEETIIRTLADSEEKGISIGRDGNTTKANWKTSPRQMLHARVVTEGITVVAPGLSMLPSEDEVADIQRAEHQEAVAALQAKIINDPLVKEMIEDRDKHLATAERGRLELASLEAKNYTGNSLKLIKDQIALHIQLAAELTRKIDGPTTEPQPEPTKPAKVIEGDFKVMPKEAPVSPATASEPPPSTKTAEPKPEPVAAKPEKPSKPPKEPDFREYKIQRMKGKAGEAYNGRLLVDLSSEEITVLAESKTVQKNLTSADPGLKCEAKMITAAFEAMPK